MKRLFAIRHLVVLAVAAATTLMVSCFKDDIIELPSGKPFQPTASEYIAFQAEAQWADEDVISRNAATRNRVGKHDLISEDGELSLPMGVYVEEGICGTTDNGKTRGAVLDAIGNSFTVWASLTNGETTELFFPAEGVVFEDDGTSYKSDPAYFWPGAGTFSFTAVANAPATGFTPNLNTARTALESFTYTVPTDATAQNDIVLATLKDVNGNANATQALNFDHIMSAVNVKIGSVVAGEIRSITFKNVYNKGNYLVDQGVWVVDKTSVGDFTVKMENGKFVSTGNDASGTPVNTEDATFMMIPQNPGDDAEMVIEFYDSATGHLYSDGEGAYKPALRGSISGDNWDKRKTTNYMLSIDESFTLTIEPVGKKLDAHFVIGYANVTVDGIDNWTITATTTDGSVVTIQPEEEVNALAKQGFWTDKVVDANGNITTESARGSSSWSGKGNVTNKLFYIFIPENISGKDREISLILKGTGSSLATTTKVLLQKYPNWTTGGFGWEVVDDAEQGRYGFKWTRKAIYEHKYKWTRILTGNGTGTWYNRKSSGEYAASLINQYNAGGYSHYGYLSAGTATERMYIYIDYTKLNNLSTSNSSSDGFSNTKALFNQGGGAASQAFETAILTAEKTKEDEEGYKDDPLAFRSLTSVKDKDSGVTYTADNGSLNDLSGILTYVLKKNRYNMQTTFDGSTTTYHAVISIDDIEWYLPAYGQFQYFTPDPNIPGDDKADYWSSTAVDGASQAYIGDGTPKDRDLEYRVIAVRKNENNVDPATVSVDNSSIAGGENGSTNNWL